MPVRKIVLEYKLARLLQFKSYDIGYVKADFSYLNRLACFLLLISHILLKQLLTNIDYMRNGWDAVV